MKTIFARFLGDRNGRKSLQILALYVALAALTRFFEDLFQASGWLPTDESSDAPIIAMAAVTIFSLLWTLFATSLQLASLAPLIRPQTFNRLRAIELLVIETLRMISASLIRIPLLLVPAIFEWIRLAPTPFIVLFDPLYAHGQTDAIQSARQYFRKHYLRVLGLLLPVLILMLAELAITLNPDEAQPLWEAPLQHAGSIIGFAIARLGLDIFILTMYARTFDRLTAAPETMSNI